MSPNGPYETEFQYKLAEAMWDLDMTPSLRVTEIAYQFKDLE